MSSYYREQGFHGRKRFFRRLRIIWTVFLILLVAGGAYVGYDVYRQLKHGDEPSNPSTAITSVVAADTQVQTNQFFQFETPKNWRVIPSESRADHFVYRQFNSTLVQQEFTVDINHDPIPVLPLVQTTHVLSVQTANGRELRPGTPSAYCKTALKNSTSRSQQVVTLNKVTFSCNPDSSNYVAVVGLENGTNAIALTRRDGSKATYYLSYRNLSAQPSAGDLVSMVRTFEAR